MVPPWTSSPSFPSQTPLVLFPSQKTWESWSCSLQSLLALSSCGVSLAVSRLQGGAALSQPWAGTALAFPQHSHFPSLPSQPWLWLSPQPCPVLAATASMLVAKRNFHTSPMDHAWALSSGPSWVSTEAHEDSCVDGMRGAVPLITVPTVCNALPAPARPMHDSGFSSSSSPLAGLPCPLPPPPSQAHQCWRIPSPGPTGLKASTPTAVYYLCICLLPPSP